MACQSNSLRRSAASLAVLLLLAGCSSSSKVLETYDLPAASAVTKRSVGARGQMVVAEPKAIANLDNERMAVKQAGGAVSYLPDGAWGDRLPKLLQARMIQSFENASMLRSVGRPADRLTADWQLVSEIRAFELDVSAGNAVRIEISAKLVGDRSGRIVAGRVFTAREAVAGSDAASVAAGFDRALQRVLSEMVVWASGAR